MYSRSRQVGFSNLIYINNDNGEVQKFENLKSIEITPYDKEVGEPYFKNEDNLVGSCEISASKEDVLKIFFPYHNAKRFNTFLKDCYLGKYTYSQIISKLIKKNI